MRVKCIEVSCPYYTNGLRFEFKFGSAFSREMETLESLEKDVYICTVAVKFVDRQTGKGSLVIDLLGH